MKSQLHSLTCVLFASGVLAGSAISQELSAEDVPAIRSLAPLEQYLQKPEEERVPAYPFLRCSGLFLGYKYYAGANFDRETRS